MLNYEYGEIMECGMMDENEMFDYINKNDGKMVTALFSDWTDYINVEKNFIIRTKRFLNKRIVRKVAIKNVQIMDEA